MILDVKFEESGQHFSPGFGEVHNISDGGFDRGYAAGYESGKSEGYEKGHTDGVAEGYESGLAARQYETWTITYVDGTVEEKEVALL